MTTSAVSGMEAAAPDPAGVSRMFNLLGGITGAAPSPAAPDAPGTAKSGVVLKPVSTALVVATERPRRPSWQNVDGFPNNTFQLERRKLNPFADINSFASRTHPLGTGARHIDCKGALATDPVQKWKEMLREGAADRASGQTFALHILETLHNEQLEARAQSERLTAANERAKKRAKSAPPGRLEWNGKAPTKAPFQLEDATRPDPMHRAAGALVTTGSGSARGGGSARKGTPRSVARRAASASRARASAEGRITPARQRPEHPRTQSASKEGQRSQEARTRALILARARGVSPTRFGPAGERKLSISARPGWRNVNGFPPTTHVTTEHRKLNNFADINSYASSNCGALGQAQGYRPLDCKGQVGQRPVQKWKEMLRGGTA